MNASHYLDELRAHVHTLLAAGMSQAQVAKAASADPMTLSRLMNDRMKSVEVQTYFNILAVRPPR